MDVQTWNHELLDRYMDSCISRFNDKQVEHMAWYLGVVAEGRKREKESLLLEQEQTDVDKSRSYGESYDDHYFGRKE